LVVPGEGTWSEDGAGNVTFTPEPGFTSDPTPITYTIEDNDGNESNAAAIVVDYVPVATLDESLANPTNTPVVVDVLNNDTTGDDVDPTTVQIVGTTNPGDPLAVPGEGTWTVNPLTGAITFTPEPGFTGDPTDITYTVKDDEGNVSDPASVNIEYASPPDITPVITAVPNVMNGVTDFNIFIRITELENVDTDGTIIVKVPIDSRWTFNGPYDSGLTILGATALDNSDWAYTLEPGFHVFTSTTVIPGGSFSMIGFEAKWDAGQTRGVYTITAQIVEGSGAEIRIDNNVDAEKLDYFID
jgi:CshA-type fibril repeat protein